MKAYLLKTVAAMLAFGVVLNVGFLLWLPRTALFTAVQHYVSKSAAVSNTVGRVSSSSPSVVGWEVWADAKEGEATLPLVIRGTRWKRRAIVTAIKRDGVWTVRRLSLK